MSPAQPLVRPRFRREQLRDALPLTLAMLSSNRPDLINPGYVEDYIALRWLESGQFGIRLTTAGQAVCGKIPHHV
jgi:hypothetical protein